MSRPKRYLVRRPGAPALLVLFIPLVALLVGCGGTARTPTEPPQPTRVSEAAPTDAPTQPPTEEPTSEPTSAPTPTEQPTNTPTQVPTATPAPTPTPTPIPVDDSGCVTCHTSEETLQALATEEEAPEIESEGEG